MDPQRRREAFAGSEAGLVAGEGLAVDDRRQDPVFAVEPLVWVPDVEGGAGVRIEDMVLRVDAPEERYEESRAAALSGLPRSTPHGRVTSCGSARRRRDGGEQAAEALGHGRVR